MGFFDDPKRTDVRVRQSVGILSDFFVLSESTDYFRLRLVINSIIGLIICYALYEIGWKNLNFGDFDYVYGMFVKWAIIGVTVYAFATSSIFRCALFCVLLGAFGKQGQYPFTMLVVSNLHEGPIGNMINNYEKTSDIVVCHIELQSKIVANRVSLMTGPLEELIDKMMAKGTRAMKTVAKETRSLLSPFLELLDPKTTKTDEKEEREKSQVADIEKRKQSILKLWEKSMGRKLTEDDAIVDNFMPPEELVLNTTIDEPPVWKKFKTGIVQKLAKKISSKCEEVFNKGIDKCKDVSGELETSCRNTITWPIDVFICPRLNMENVCDAVQRKVQSMNICRNQFEKTNLDPSLEGDLRDVVQLTSQLENNANIELHTVRVESRRVEIEYRLSDLKIKIRAASMWFKNIVGISKQLFQAIFIYFLYTIFRDSVGMIRKYQNDVAFENSFVTNDFWMIDNYRKQMDLAHLTRFTKQEKREWKIKEVFGFPTKEERQKAVRPFMKWFALVITVAVVIILDYYLYTFMDSVVESARQQVKQKTVSAAGFQVSGEGVVADFLKTMTSSNQTMEVDQTLSNEHCLMKPVTPNTQLIILWLVIPLIISFFFQVVFSFAIRRIVLNYFLPYMYPKRCRVRLIYFYNKCLIQREKYRKEARARIRFMAQRRKVETNLNNEFLNNGTFFKRQIFDRLFKTAKCMVCQEKAYPKKLKYCGDVKCQTSYCIACIEDNFGKCYACSVVKKEVDAENTKMMAPDEDSAKDVFLTYGKYLENISRKPNVTGA